MNEPTPLVATSSSGLPVMIRVKSGPAGITNGMITITAPGTVWVTAEQAGDQTFAPISEVRAFNLRQAAVSLVGQYSDSVVIGDFAVSGHFIYAACGHQGVRVFDMADPTLPRLVGQYPAPTDSRKVSAEKICVAGNMAFIANNPVYDPAVSAEIVSSSFEVLDVSDPTKPVLRGSLSWWQDLGPGSPLAVQVAGQNAYVSHSSGALVTIDLSNPAKPTLLPVNDFESAGRISSFRIVGSLIYLVGDNLSIWDISTPTAPHQIAQYFDVYGRAIRVSGSSVYALSETGSLMTWKFDSANLVFGASFPISGSSFDASGDYIFVSRSAFKGADEYHPGGIQVFDASNPAKLVEVGGYRDWGSAFEVSVFGETVYVAGEANTPLKALTTILREPPEPRLEISRPTLGASTILSAPSIPGWQVQGSYSLTPGQAEWQDITWFVADSFLEESNGIKRFSAGRGLEKVFFRMHKLDF